MVAVIFDDDLSTLQRIHIQMFRQNFSRYLLTFNNSAVCHFLFLRSASTNFSSFWTFCSVFTGLYSLLKLPSPFSHHRLYRGTKHSIHLFKNVSLRTCFFTRSLMTVRCSKFKLPEFSVSIGCSRKLIKKIVLFIYTKSMSPDSYLCTYVKCKWVNLKVGVSKQLQSV